MDLRASGCYYHPGRLAVATCAKCGVGICRSCAVREQGRILCYKCANKDIVQEHKEYRKLLKERGGNFSYATDFIAPAIKGIVLAIIIPIALDWFYRVQGDSFAPDIGLPFIRYALFSSPFLYTILDDLFAPKWKTINDLVGNWWAKALVSLLFGGFAFPFILIRFIIKKIIRK